MDVTASPRRSLADVLDRAELVVDVATPFLGLLAVAFTCPDRLGWLGVTGWLLLVLDFYLSTLVARAVTLPQRLRRLAGPLVVLAGQAFDGAPGWVDWAIESAICGMGARALALAWLFVREGVRRRTQKGLGTVIVVLVLIVGFSAATVLAFVDTWRALHEGWSDAAQLASGVAAAWWADVGRLDVNLASAKPRLNEKESTAWILALLFLWLIGSFTLRAWVS